MRIILELLGLYLLYKLIFDFIIPAYDTSKQVKRKMDEMQQRASQFQQQQQAGHQPGKKPAPSAKEDYIEFEEVK